MYRNVALLVLIAFTSIALGKNTRWQQNEKYEIAVKDCAVKSGIHPGLAKILLKSRSRPSASIKCVNACVMKQYGYFNADGTVNIRKIIKDLPPNMPKRDQAIEVIEECGNEKGENDCETAHAMAMCFYEKRRRDRE